MTRWLAFVSALALGACATLDEPTSANLAQYCTAENAYRLGSQARVYLGVCPKETEAAFLQGLARGRQVRWSTPVAEPYFEQIQRTEQRLVATSSEPERESLRTRLRDLEWWSEQLLLRNNGTYMP
jgi:Protein of unknown function (DUF2799)